MGELTLWTVDPWSIVHLCFFFILSVYALRLKIKSIILLAIVLGVGWEVIELLWVEKWLGFHEPWLNRGSDIIFDVLGAYLAVKVSKT